MLFSPLVFVLLPLTGPVEYTIDAVSGGDIAPQLAAAVRTCEADPPDPKELSSGCIFNLPAGTFVLSETITLCRQHRIVGKGGRGWGARTKLLAPKTAFRLARADAVCKGRGRGAAWSELLDFGLVLSPNVRTATASYGIESAARFFASGLWIRGGTHGIHIEADRSQSGNANSSHVTDTLIEESDHAGIFIRGGDTNVILVEASSVVGACRRASRWARFGPCASVVNMSYLGSTFVAMHTAGARDLDVTIPVGSPSTGLDAGARPGYLFRGDSSRSVCVGCYAETNQTDSFLDRTDMALGGLATWTGQGLWLDGPFASGFVVRNTSNPANATTLRLGNWAAASTWLELESKLLGLPLRIKSDVKSRLFLIDIGNVFPVLSITPDGRRRLP
jgi:hypothetical protein